MRLIGSRVNALLQFLSMRAVLVSLSLFLAVPFLWCDFFLLCHGQHSLQRIFFLLKGKPVVLEDFVLLNRDVLAHLHLHEELVSELASPQLLIFARQEGQVELGHTVLAGALRLALGRLGHLHGVEPLFGFDLLRGLVHVLAVLFDQLDLLLAIFGGLRALSRLVGQPRLL